MDYRTRLNEKEFEKYNKEDFPEDFDCEPEEKKENKPYKYMPFLIQFLVCFFIVMGALFLKSVGGDLYIFVKSWYNEKISDSLIAGSDIKEAFKDSEFTIKNVPNITKEKLKIDYKKEKIKPLELSVRVANPLEIGYISSNFGEREDPFSKEEKFHKGLDIKAEEGSPIKALLAGRVEKAEPFGGYGNCVIIDHGNNIKTLYAHCKEIKVSKEMVVNRGQEIALIGTTGRSTGAHLHLEVRINEKRCDPKQFLKDVYV